MVYYTRPSASTEDTSNSDDSSSEDESNQHQYAFNVYQLATIATQNYWLEGYTCNFDLQTGALASVAVEVNTNRVQCDKCQRWFGHNEMLQAHIRQNTIACSRCGDSSSKIVACDGVTKHILGCEQHKRCYSSEDDLKRHFRNSTHKRCYWPGCNRKYVTGEWSTSRISSHIRNS